VTTTASSGFGTRHVSLGCADSLGVQPGDAVDAIPFEGLTRMSAREEPPRARDVGLRLPSGMNWFFRKNPLVMRQGAADFTLTASGPSQAFAWVPAGAWTTGDIDLSRWSASSVTLHSCPDRAAQFLGGILAGDLHTCLRMTMRQAGEPDRTVRQHLDGSPCSAG
jgi:hypothetical protein